jgi:hypothetical protein
VSQKREILMLHNKTQNDSTLPIESIDSTVPRMFKIRNIEHSARGIAYIPLTKNFNPFIAMREGWFARNVTSFLGPFDKGLTPVRYAAVAPGILYDISTPGWGIEFMHSGHPFGLALELSLLIPIGFIALFNLYLEHLEQQKELNETKSEFQHINKVIEDIEKGRLKEKYTEKEKVIQLIKIFEDFNRYLKSTIQNDAELREKYAFIEIEFPENSEELNFQQIYENTRFKVVSKTSPEAAYSRANYVRLNLLEEKRKGKDISLLPEKSKNALDTEMPDEIENNSRWEKFKNFCKKTLWNIWIKEYLWNIGIKEYLWKIFCKHILRDKLLKPLFNAGNLISFGYWAVWIVMGVATGIHASAGIFGAPNWVSFIVIPVVFGLPYLAIRAVNYFTRLYHWKKEGHGVSFKEFDEHARLQHQIEEDFTKVARQTRERMQEDADWDRLYAENHLLTNQLNALQSQNNEPKSRKAQPKYAFHAQYGNKYAKAAATGTTEFVNNQVALHYITWFGSDLTVAGLGLTIGAALTGPISHALLIISSLYGIASAAYRYHESKKANKVISDHQENGEIIPFEKCKKRYEAKEARLACLKMALYEFKKSPYQYSIPSCMDDPENDLVDLSPKTFWQKTKSAVINFGFAVRKNPWVQAWDWTMSGIFFSRVVVPAASVAFFYALPGLAVVLGLANPITLGLVVGLGLLYVGLKWYEKKEKLKEKEFAEFHQKEEKIDEKIAMGELALDTYQKRIDLKTLTKQSKKIPETSHMGLEFTSDPNLQNQSYVEKENELDEKPLTFQQKIENNKSANDFNVREKGEVLLGSENNDMQSKISLTNTNMLFRPQRVKSESFVPLSSSAIVCQ